MHLGVNWRGEKKEMDKREANGALISKINTRTFERLKGFKI